MDGEGERSGGEDVKSGTAAAAARAADDVNAAAARAAETATADDMGR